MPLLPLVMRMRRAMPHRNARTGWQGWQQQRRTQYEPRKTSVVAATPLQKTDMAEHVRELGRFDGIHGQFARDRARTITHVLRALERVTRLPADPTTDYRGPTP